MIPLILTYPVPVKIQPDVSSDIIQNLNSPPFLLISFHSNIFMHGTLFEGFHLYLTKLAFGNQF